MTKFLTMTETAEIVGLSNGMISKHMKENKCEDIAYRFFEGVPKQGRGSTLVIDSAKYIDWLCRRRVKTDVSDDEDGTSINQAKLDLVIEQKRKLKIDNDLAEGDTLDAGEVQAVFSQAIVQLAAMLDGAAGKMSKGDAVLRQHLFDEHRRIRTVYAEKLQTIADRLESGEADGVATEEGGVEVGE